MDLGLGLVLGALFGKFIILVGFTTWANVDVNGNGGNVEVGSVMRLLDGIKAVPHLKVMNSALGANDGRVYAHSKISVMGVTCAADMVLNGISGNGRLLDLGTNTGSGPLL